jgi:prepilin-type N-terminal cleavage/methylation domain-containing protein
MRSSIKLNRNDNGFSLLEIIMSMLIVALMAFSLIFLFLISYNEAIYQSQIMIATDLAVEQLELIKQKKYEDIYSGAEDSVPAYPDFKRIWYVEDNYTAANLKRIVVIVEKKSSATTKPVKVQLVLYINKG